jgi:hypothetical protein
MNCALNPHASDAGVAHDGILRDRGPGCLQPHRPGAPVAAEGKSMPTDREPSTVDADSVGPALLAPAAVLLALALGIGGAQWWSASPTPAEPTPSAATLPSLVPGDGFAARPERSDREATAAGGSGPATPAARDTSASMR